MVLKTRPRHGGHAPVTARRRILVHIGIAAAILSVATGCNEPDGYPSDQYPSFTEAEYEATAESRRLQDRAEEYFRSYEATRDAKRDEEYRREAEEAHEDAIRSCILAGNHPNLCELDPQDPYGTDPRE